MKAKITETVGDREVWGTVNEMVGNQLDQKFVRLTLWSRGDASYQMSVDMNRLELEQFARLVEKLVGEARTEIEAYQKKFSKN